jgi:transposase-like protein
MAQNTSRSTAIPKEESPVAGVPPRSVGERSEPERSGGTPACASAAAPPAGERSPAPDPEVVPKPRRRTFSVEYKLRILREAERCTRPGQVGALLRREGLYSSHLTEWGRLRDQGFLATAGERRRGRTPRPIDPSAKRVAELECENRRLSEKLRKAEIIIDFQKKVQALLSIQDEAETK